MFLMNLHEDFIDIITIVVLPGSNEERSGQRSTEIADKIVEMMQNVFVTARRQPACLVDSKANRCSVLGLAQPQI